MIVADASIIVDALIHRKKAFDRIVEEEIACPHLVDAEVGQTLRKLNLSGDLGDGEGEIALAYDSVLTITRFEHRQLAGRAWQLRHNLSFYDALYVSLAEALDVPLVTLDKALAGTPGTSVLVEVLGTN